MKNFVYIFIIDEHRRAKRTAVTSDVIRKMFRELDVLAGMRFVSAPDVMVTAHPYTIV